MKTRILLFLFLLGANVYAQIVPSVRSLRGLSVVSKTYFTTKGQNKINGDVAALTSPKESQVRTNARVKEAQLEVARVYKELKRQPSSITLSGASFASNKLTPGVYHIQGDVHLTKSFQLTTHHSQEGVFIFQVEGNLVLDPSVAITLQEGVQPKNIFWQVNGRVILGPGSTFKGTIVAAGDITTEKGASVQGNLWTMAGGVALNNTLLEGPYYSDMQVSQVVEQGPYSRGDHIKYVITLKNLGPDDNTKVNLKFGGLGMSIVGKPKNLYHFSGKDPGPAEYKMTPNSISWSYFPVIFPAEDSVVYEVTVSLDQTEFSTSVLTVLGNNIDDNIRNNSLEKSLCATPPMPGQVQGKTLLCTSISGYVFEVEDMEDARRFVWSVPQGWIITSGGTTNRITVTTGGMQAVGVVSVQAENACGKSEASILNVSTVAAPAPLPPPITGKREVCLEQQNLTYSIEEVPGTISYTWELPTGWSVLDGEGTREVKVNAGSTAGTLRVTVENMCGVKASSALQVTVLAAPVAPSRIHGETMICASAGTSKYSVTELPNAESYIWTVTHDWEIIGGQGTREVTVKPGTGAGMLTVQAQYMCDTSGSVSLPVQVFTTPPVVGAITGSAVVCSSGTTQTYSVTEEVGVKSYQWSVPADWSITGGQGTSEIRVTAGSNSGEVSVMALGVCTPATTVSYKVTVNPTAPEALSAIKGSILPCIGQNGATYWVDEVAGATKYMWEVPTGWEIISGQESPMISVRVGATAGQITVFAKNDCDKKSALVSLAVKSAPPAPSLPAIAGNAAPCIGKQGIYSVVNPVSGAGYAWELPEGWSFISGQGTASIKVVIGASAGQIKVKADNVCDTGGEGSLAITPSTSAPIANLKIEGSKTWCAGSPDVLMYALPTVRGASSVQWYVPTGWTILTDQQKTTVTIKPGANSGYVKVTAWNECHAHSDSVLVTVEPSAPIALSPIKGEQAPCGQTEEVEYSVDLVAGAKQYTWSVPAGWDIVEGGNTNKIRVKVGRAAGRVTVTASYACAIGEPVSLAVSPVFDVPAPPAAIKGEVVPCLETQQIYRVENPVAGVVYVWTIPSGWKIVSGNSTPTLVVKTGTNTGLLSVVAKNNCGISAAQTLAVAPISSVPVSVQVQGPEVVCANSVQTYSIVGNTNGVDYQWTLPASWNIMKGQGTAEIEVRAGAAGAGEVVVLATNSCGTTQKSLAVQVRIPQLAALGPIMGEKNVCAQKTQATYSIQPVTGADSYEWEVPAGWEVIHGNGTTSITVKTGTTTGQISVLAKNSCHSTKAALDVSITTSIPDALGGIIGTGEVCAGTRVTYQVPEGSGISSYEWSFPADWTIETGQGTASVTLITGQTSGAVRVIAKNGCGTSTDASIRQVQVQNSVMQPNNIQVKATDLTPCENQRGIVFRIDPVAGATSYLWNFPPDWQVESGQGTNEITLRAGKTAGTVSVIAKNTCSISADKGVAVAPRISTPLVSEEITGRKVFCAGGEAVTYHVSGVSGAVSYFWSFPSDWTLVSGKTTTLLTVIPASSGTLEFSALNACGDIVKKSFTVTQSTEVVPPEIAGPTEFCINNAPQEYEVPAINEATYNWEIPAGWRIISGKGTNKVILTTQEAGMAVIKVHVVNSCGKSATSSLRVNAVYLPGDKPIIADESTACNGYQFSVPVQKGSVTYTWSIASATSDWTIIEGEGTNRIKVKGPTDANPSSAQIKLVVKNQGCSSVADTYTLIPGSQNPEMQVPNTFSPNNDGKNDLWVIAGLKNYPVNEVVILNRWGSEVYRQKGYKNSWNGNGLAEGTYFYVLTTRLCDNREVTMKGYVMLMR